MIEPPPERREAAETLEEQAYRQAASGVEAILLVAGGPVPLGVLADALGMPAPQLRPVLDRLAAEYAARGIRIQEIAGGYQLATRPSLGRVVERFLRIDRHERLSKAALETLAIVAYRQPVTRAEIEAVRGVRPEYALEVLGERGLIREVGRLDRVGRPILYGTTEGFLRAFGLRSLDDLPPLEGREITEMLEPR